MLELPTDTIQKLIEVIVSQASPTTASVLLLCLGLVFDRSRLTKRIENLEAKNDELIDKHSSEMADLQQALAELRISIASQSCNRIVK